MGKDLKGKELGAGLFQRMIKGSAFYEKKFRHEGRQISVYGKTLKEVEKKARLKQETLENGIIGSVPTLGVYFDAWADYKRTVGKIKQSSLGHYKRLFEKHIRPRFGKKKLNTLKTAEIKQFQADLLKSLKPSSVNSITDLLHLILESAVNDQLLLRNPVILEAISTESAEERTNSRALSAEEQAIFIDYSKAFHYYNAIRLLFATGMRSGELRGLKWSDYDKEKGVLYIRRTASVDLDNNLTMNTPKTKNSLRTLPLNNEIREILEDQRRQQYILNNGIIPIDGYMFLSTQGKVISRTALKKSFEQISARIQKDYPTFERISPHACRHTFITQKLYDGANPYAVKAFVGHSMSAKVTENIYTGVDESKVIEMIAGKDEAIAE